MLCASNAEVFAIYSEEKSKVCARREEIVENPMRDFTRKTKVTIPLLMDFLVSSGSESLKPAVQDFFDDTPQWNDPDSIPYVSTLTEARKKLRPEALELLFTGVTRRLMALAAWENDKDLDFHLLPRAVDGTSFPYDSSYEYSDASYSAKGTKSWRQECTAIQDMETNLFVDAVIHGVCGKGTGEPADFAAMIDRAEVPDGSRILYIADRVYAVPNVLAHLQESGQYFLIRDKDVDSHGFIGSLRLPGGEFDIDLDVKIGRTVPHLFKSEDGTRTRCIAENTRFDYIEPGSRRTYMLHVRVLRRKIDGEWVVLLTNLPRDKFTAEDIQHLYAMRWGEEISFRDLKYTPGTLAFHARLDKLITQEIWAKLLLFNMCAVIAASAPAIALQAAGERQIPRSLKIFREAGPDRIAVNFVEAVHVIRLDFVRRQKTPVELADCIIKYKERIRPNRHEPRRMHPRRRFYLNYRAA